MSRSQSEKVSKFVEAITKEANEQREAIAKETQKFVDRELAAAKNKALEDSYHLIQHRAESVRSDVGRELSKQELESRRALFERRSEMQAEVFDAAASKLKEFVAGPQYPAFLERCAVAICDALGKDCVLLVRPQDETMVPSLQQTVRCKEIRLDPTISLGGCKGVTPVLAADSTLDSRLSAQKQWFVEHSGLTFDE